MLGLRAATACVFTAIADVVGVGVGAVNVIGVPEDEVAMFGTGTLSSLRASVNVKTALGDSSAFT